MRASKRPYFCSKSPTVFNRAEVYSRAIPSAPVYFSLLAVITKLPPCTCAFCVRFVYVSSSSLPHPLPPVSMTHLDESGNDPLVPVNSSLQVSTYSVGGVVGCEDPPQYNVADSRTISPQGQLDPFVIMRFSPSGTNYLVGA